MGHHRGRLLRQMAQTILALLIVSMPISVPFTDATCPSLPNIYPCRCRGFGDDGLSLRCEEVNIALLYSGIARLQSVAISRLDVVNATMRRLYGLMFNGLLIKNLTITRGNLRALSAEVLTPLNETLIDLNVRENDLDEVPVESLKPLNKLYSLDLSHNRIAAVPDNAFATLGRLFEINLSKNRIKKLAPKAFVGQNNLERLHLHFNEIATFDKNTFRNMRKLKYLDLTANSLDRIQKTDFQQLTGMWVLNVSQNHVAMIPRATFVTNTVLRVLNISYNALTEIDQNTVKGLRFLRDSYFRANRISRIDKKAFAAAKHVRTIDLAYNRLQDVPYEQFKEHQWLERLDLSHNNISRIATQAFSKMYQVHIDLSHNNLSFVGNKSFSEIANMTTLDLSHNLLSEMPNDAFSLSDCTTLKLMFNNFTDMNRIPIANLSSIKVLNVTHNRLMKIDRKAFTKKRLYELHTADFSHNNLSDIQGNPFEKFASLRFLNLSHNQIRKIGFSTFGNLPTLLELDISHNVITDVAHSGLSALGSVRLIHAQHNRIRKMFPIPIALNELHVENNDLQQIYPGTINVMNSLLRLYLDNNNLTNILPGAFDGLNALQELSLAGNNITEIPYEALEVMTAIQHLYLHNNSLTLVKKRDFDKFPTLLDLRLDQNRIWNITRDAFIGSIQLQRLNMSYNNMSELSPTALTGLVSLRVLDLSHNRLRGLQNKTHGLLDGLLSLEYLNVSSNVIGTITDKTFPRNPYVPYQLREVNMSSNYLSYVPSLRQPSLQRAHVLDLSNNLINQLERDAFTNLTDLRHLSLRRNDLRILRNGYLEVPKELLKLDLSHNRLSEFTPPEGTFSPNMTLLDLRHNNISRISVELFPLVKNRLRVFYADNPLHCECSLAWLVSFIQRNQQPQEAEQWTNTFCVSPVYLAGRAFSEIALEKLNCDGDPTEQATGDITFRFVQVGKKFIELQFYVSSRQDIGGFRVEIHSSVEAYLSYQAFMPYSTRFHRIPRDAIRTTHDVMVHTLCVLATDSENRTRTIASRHQCQMLHQAINGAESCWKTRSRHSVIMFAMAALICNWMHSLEAVIGHYYRLVVEAVTTLYGLKIILLKYK
ncbi:chaoptin-like [Tropilaelaps mercedesae]|uniref:Chaoptin-like n=1 Tax=Tropilaelaps mercedesae TaxID=418985 RepID=A0A1V9XG33_9ACAR|nr:chaoptin-like [Tropilaelaps mercedesae]